MVKWFLLVLIIFLIVAVDFVVSYFESCSPFDYLDPDYANRLSMEGSVAPTTLIVAMIYLERLRLMDKTQFESSDPADLFSSALVSLRHAIYSMSILFVCLFYSAVRFQIPIRQRR